MDTDPDSDEVFRKARWKSALAFLSCIAFLALGLWLFNLPVEDYSRRTPPEPLTKAISVVCILLFGWGGAVAFANTVEPSRLILNSMGFRVEGPSAKPLVRWDNVDEFFVEEIRHFDQIFYREATGHAGVPGRKCGLAGHFEQGPNSIACALNRRLKVHRLRLEEHSEPSRPLD